MYAMTFLISASFLVLRESCISSLPSTLTLGLVVRCLRSAACASGLLLYLAAVSLKEGPSFFALTEWHFMQPLFFISASAAATSWAGALSDHPKPAASARPAIALIDPPCRQPMMRCAASLTNARPAALLMSVKAGARMAYGLCA